MSKFLILRFSAIGDIVLTSPVLRCIKTQIQDAEIHYAVKTNFKAAVADNVYVDQFHFLDNNLNELIKIWKEENFDYIIDLHHNLRTFRIKLALWNVKSYSFNKLNWQKWVLVKFKKNYLPQDPHIVNRYLETVATLGVKNDNKGLDFFIPEEQEKYFFSLPNIYQTQNYIAISAASSRATKMFAKEKLLSLCKKINYPIIILGSKADKLDIDFVANALPDKVFNACGDCTLAASAFIMKKAALVIAYDTGLMHIAAALKKQTISIWGNTVPEMGMIPYQNKHWIIENKIPCRPCSKIGYAKCPKKHFNCMEQINVKEIINIIDTEIHQ